MLSRRQWLGRSLTLVGLPAVATRAAAETTGKITQAAAHYQDHPNDMQMCAMCKFFIRGGGRARSGMMGGHMGGMMGGQTGPGMMAAGTCELVEGSISPMGWCVLYRRLSG